ncbi:uncharacterized protein MYCGRDRAFT_95719 [Zymoseptoria tritici IPO323]|uniref:Apple domain-containing protein n=1 Tax=Zymoseptoria tritici (strain CBS 115943 / IPO323) TaxID=336722 RepID=F9XK84_ZYMTI|nr:uncharacterized protein MYCGRDRAFT_95719 [Zymoseptoria tritici IPO323]EGP84688.1 hypothetical protein MYCGRDRAFT_95719 [Zymoseptoria tritici IPO323]
MLFHTLLAAGLPLTTALTHAALDSQPAAAELSLDKRQSICGVSGYDDDNHKPFEVILKKAWNAEQCSAYCKSRARCQSFAIGNDECKLYCEPVSGTYKSGRSQYKFYGRDCPYSPSKQLVSHKSVNHCYNSHYEPLRVLVRQPLRVLVRQPPRQPPREPSRRQPPRRQPPRQPPRQPLRVLLIDASTSSIWSKNSGTTIDAVKTQDSLPATEIAITCEFLPETANTLSCEDPTNTAVNKLGFCASLDNSLALADGGADCTFYNYRAVCETSPFTPPFLISATDPATGSFLGYITAAYFSFGIRDLTTTASEALQVTYDPSSGETGHPSQLTITSLNSADYQDLTLLSILAFVQTSEDNPPQDMRSGSNKYVSGCSNNTTTCP